MMSDAEQLVNQSLLWSRKDAKHAKQDIIIKLTIL